MLVPLEHRLDRPQNEIEQLTSSISRSVLALSARTSLTAKVATPLYSATRQNFRKMSTSQWADDVPEKYNTYLVVVPDLPDSKRAELRQQHLENAAVGHKNGRVVDGSAYYKEDPATLGREPTVSDMGGSYQIVRAANAQEVREKFAQDIYGTGGAWDLSKLQVIPIMNKPL